MTASICPILLTWLARSLVCAKSERSPIVANGSLIHKVLHGGEPSLRANMDNDVVSISEQRFSRSVSKPVSGAGDEDTSLLVGVRRRRRRSLFLPRIQRGLRDGRCGCHKGPRDYPKAYLHSRDDKSSTVHGRAVLFERILVWFVVRLLFLHARSLVHSVFPGQSFHHQMRSRITPLSNRRPR